MKLAVVIPCYNEEKTIRRVLRSIPRTIRGVSGVDRIVVDDGSSDKTGQAAAEEGAVVVTHPVNRGVGMAFQTGVEQALQGGAEIIINVDGDGQFDPQDIPKLVGPLIDGLADFVTASRFADPTLIPKMPAVKLWGNRGMSWLISSLSGQRMHDVSCGFRAYSRDAALNLNLMGAFTYTQEMVLNLAFKGFRIMEVPIRVRGEREFGRSRVAGNISSYAIRSAKIIFRCYRDYHPFRFFGTLAMWCTLLAAGLLGFFFLHYLTTGTFSGHLWAGFLGGSLGFTGLVLFVVATVADMLDRVRANQEKILFYLKSHSFTEEHRDERDSPGDPGGPIR